MRDPLDLKFTNIESYTTTPSDEIKKHGERLLSINDIREKLQYYNKHICSLSYQYSEGLFCFGQSDWRNGYGQIFFKLCHNQNNDPDLEIYLEERQREIDRLNALIIKQPTYRERLKCFIEQKAGQFRYTELTVPTLMKVPYTTDGVAPYQPNVIDLAPVLPEEIKEYNLYLYNYVNRLIENPNQFHRLTIDSYKGFLSKIALESLNRQLEGALDKPKTTDNEIKRIEIYFSVGCLPNYIEHLYPWNAKNYVVWQSAWLNAFINGRSYDFSRQQLSVHDIKALFHVQQVFEYYKQVLKLKVNPFEKNNQQLSLDSIFNDKSNAYEICKDLMDYLDLTIDGSPNPHLKKGRAGNLGGLIVAIKEAPQAMLKIDTPTEPQLFDYFKSFLNPPFKTFDKRSKDFRLSYEHSKKYIKDYFKKVTTVT